MRTSINSFSQCISDLERKQRLTVYLVSGLLLLILAGLVVVSRGGFLIFGLIGWVISLLTAEYNVRKLQAIGTSVSDRQFPELHQAVKDVCQQFGVTSPCRVIVLNIASTNAFAIRFARKRVIVIFSELLEGIITEPAQLRALVAHELCHSTLDHGLRHWFELYKPARFKQGRELTCDNAAYAVTGDLHAVKQLFCRLCVGNRLAHRIDETELQNEAAYIESGLVGWLLRKYLSHPPFGTRITNIHGFASLHPAAAACPPALSNPPQTVPLR